MRNFNNRSSRPSGGGKRFGSNRDFNRPSMHRAVCDECGNDCEVPFRPTGDKPIYCSNCFQDKRDAGPSKFSKKDFRKSNFDDKKRYTAVCSKCGKSCEVPFKPTEGKPVYCDECFGKGGGAARKETAHSNEQFEILSAKLDKIIKLLTPAVPVATFPKMKETAKEVKVSEPKMSLKKVAEKKVPAKKATIQKTAAKNTSKKKIK